MPVELVNVQEIPLEGIQRISVSYISESIRIFSTESDKLILKEYFNDGSPSVLADVQVADDSIVIRHGERAFMFSFLRGHVELYVPRAYYGVLNAKSVSGRIEAAGRLVLSELALSNTSGRIVLGDVTAGTAVLSSVSGTIEVQALRALANVHSTSGAVRIASADGAGDFKTVSGTVDVNYRSVTGDIKMSSTSGRVRLTVPPLLSFSLDASSLSGSIHVPMRGNLTGGRNLLQGTIGDGPQVHVRLKTVSGRIEVLASS